MKNFYTNVVVRGDKILFRGIHDGKRVMQKIDGYKPVIYLPASDGEFQTIYGERVKEFSPGSIKETRDFVKQYSDIDNFRICGMTNIDVQWISDHYEDDIEYDTRLLRVANMDVEVFSDQGFPNEEKAEFPITAITIRDSLDGISYVWAYKEDYKPKRPDIKYIKCADERDLLKKILVHFINNPPDIITGWNVRFFDIPYVVNRISRILGADKVRGLSPWGVVNEREVTIAERTRKTYEILGVTTMDALELYQKFTYTKQESYKLSYIARVEKLNVQKLTFNGTLAELYNNNFEYYIDYNIADVDVVDSLLKKHNFIDTVLYIAYRAKVNWATAFGPVATWDATLYNYFRKQGLVIPPAAVYGKNEQYEGAFVKEPQPGKYGWTVSFDLNSLYPMIAIQWNISPEMLTHVELPYEIASAPIDALIDGKVDLSPIKEMGLTMCANKACFKKEFRGALGTLFAQLYDERSIAKKKMLAVKQQIEDGKDTLTKEQLSELEYQKQALHNRQLSTKIFLNSAYGALGNNAFRYFSIELAEAITITGKLVIQWAETRVNRFMNRLVGTKDVNYVMMVDTDALYINFEPLIKKLGLTDTAKIVKTLDKFGADDFKKFLDKTYKELFDYTNAFEERMEMKRENIADACVIVAKKRYAMSVWNSEGVSYKEQDIKITGIESVRSSTPEYCRDKIKTALKYILMKTEGELQDYVEQVEEEFKTLPVASISKPTGVNGMKKYASPSTVYIKGTPGHVKGSLIYNHLLKAHGLENKYEIIRDGDKIKLTYLELPNPIRADAISFPDVLPTEFGLDKYVDVDTQFEKTFLAPVKKITDVIGWEVRKVASLF